MQLVTKRQASDITPDEQYYCHIQVLDIYCSSGYYQLIADIYMKCGENDYARVYANWRAQNEMGEYYQTVYYIMLDYVDGSCSESLASCFCCANCRV